MDAPSEMSVLFTWRSAVASSHGPESPTTRLVLLVLSLHMSERGRSCYPGTRRLASESGLSRRAAEKHLNLAIDAGWLRRKERERQPDGRWTLSRYMPRVPDGVGNLVRMDLGNLATQPWEPDDFIHGNDVPHRTSVGGRQKKDDRGSQNGNLFSGSEVDVASEMHRIYLEVLGGDPPHLKLTGTRRKLYRAMHAENLTRHAKVTVHAPLDIWRAACEAVRDWDWSGKKREYEYPDSWCRNESKRERWALEALGRLNGDGASAGGGITGDIPYA